MALQPNSGAGKDRYIKQLEKQVEGLEEEVNEYTAANEELTQAAVSNIFIITKNKKLLRIISELTTMLLEK